jgi:hypothetical protein
MVFEFFLKLSDICYLFMRPSGYFMPKSLQILKPNGSSIFSSPNTWNQWFFVFECFQIIKTGNCSKNKIPTPTLEKTNVGQFQD